MLGGFGAADELDDDDDVDVPLVSFPKGLAVHPYGPGLTFTFPGGGWKGACATLTWMLTFTFPWGGGLGGPSP